MYVRIAQEFSFAGLDSYVSMYRLRILPPRRVLTYSQFGNRQESTGFIAIGALSRALSLSLMHENPNQNGEWRVGGHLSVLYCTLYIGTYIHT